NWASAPSAARCSQFRYSPLAIRLFSQLRRRKGVAARNRAGLEAGVEPALALLGAAVGEAVGYDVALRSPLQRVVADRGGRAQGRLDVSGLDERRLAFVPEHRVLAVRPHPGEAVGLQLDLHLDVIGRSLAAGRALRLLRLRQDAEQVLHVVADLVRDHVG